MLVLSRKTNESICISDKIVVTMLGIHGKTVRLGIEAPIDVPVRRQEVQEKHDRRRLVRVRQVEVKLGANTSLRSIAAACVSGSSTQDTAVSR
jgi:carbon storage regulator